LSSDGSAVNVNVGEEVFNGRFAECPVLAYFRNGALHSIYKRVTDIPDDFNAYNIFTDTWRDRPSNVLNIDFEIYSSLVDLENGANRWEYCNYNDPDVGYPRDCGPTTSIHDQWFSMPDGEHNSRGITSGTEFKFLDVCPTDTRTIWNLLRTNVECGDNANEVDLGTFDSVDACAEACRSRDGCTNFIYGKGSKTGRCWDEGITESDCSYWADNEFDFYTILANTEEGVAVPNKDTSVTQSIFETSTSLNAITLTFALFGLGSVVYGFYRSFVKVPDYKEVPDDAQSEL